MTITIIGLENITERVLRAINRLPQLVTEGLIEGGKLANYYASQYQFAYKWGPGTGDINANYTYTVLDYNAVGLYSSSNHWEYVEWGTGIFHYPEPRQAWYKPTQPFKGWHKGQKPQRMLYNAVIQHFNEIKQKVSDTIGAGI